MLRALSVFTLVLAGFLSFAIFTSTTNGDETTSSNASHLDKGQLPQRITSIDLNKEFNFAGERLPMENFDVRERLDRELMRNTYWHSNTFLNIKKAGRYFPIIEEILERNNIPTDFKYLAVAESDLRNATSPAGAKGFWQFMKATGQSYGLEVNSEVDERFHLEKATEAACKHLRKLRERFGSWTLAAAAYNRGSTGLKKEVDAQRGESYFDLNLNDETSRYVFRIVAIKEIMENPAAFGFMVADGDKYPPLPNSVHILVDKAIPNLGDFAKNNGTTYRMIKIYNPWLRTSKLTNKSRKDYLVRVPKN